MPARRVRGDLRLCVPAPRTVCVHLATRIGMHQSFASVLGPVLMRARWLAQHAADPMVSCRASFVGCPVPLPAARSAAIGRPRTRPRPPARAARAPPALVTAAPIVSHHLGAQHMALAPGAGTRAGPAAATVPRSAAASAGAARALTAALLAGNGRTAFVSAMRAASSGRLPPLPSGCLGDSGHRSSSRSRNRRHCRSGGRSRRLFARRRPARNWRRGGALLCEGQTAPARVSEKVTGGLAGGNRSAAAGSSAPTGT